MDKALAISQLITALVGMAETELQPIWNIVHAVKSNGASAVTINTPAVTPQIPQVK